MVIFANHTVLVNKSGKEYAIQDSAAPIKNPEGAILGVVLVFSDVTEPRSLSRQISYQASHDMLTGLINRHEFENRLKRVLETAHSLSTNNALCYLDLDQFKLVNDTCGHIAGDELLRQVSKLLQEIAEFVENEALLEKLREIGVDYAQGYWIAHPRPIEDEEIFKS